MFKLRETADKVDMKDYPPFGPGFDAIVIDRAALMEVWGSSFKDDGQDFTEFRLLDADGNVIATRRVNGY